MRVFESWLTRARVRWTPSSIEDLERIVESGRPRLHPIDRSSLVRSILVYRHASTAETKKKVLSCVQDLANRYGPYPVPSVDEAVSRVRADLPPLQRGRGVEGYWGTFCRGDAVSREVEGSSIEDGIVIEVEPSSPHARRFGRMAAVYCLDRNTYDRWYLDTLHHGRRYGRPW